jgi:UDP-N-acetylmuramyl pentapeptide phosphotransferase/UDP-N-acetylglucosamine-1-phosphate transferase
LIPLGGAVLLLACVGAIDDVRALPVLPRLILQLVALVLIIASLPSEIRAAPIVPLWMERAAELLAGLWFVNLVNFMDGLDWMTVAEVVPITAGVLALSWAVPLPPLITATSAVLLGAIIGFAPFNRPVATLFLGDGGSLPIGLMLFWLLLHLAGAGYVAAALLLPLYYLGDATITLLKRLFAGENIAQAHHSHFYQCATDRGWSVMDVVTRVFIVNVMLVALSAATVLIQTLVIDLVALALGSAAVGWLLFVLARGRR